MTRIGPRVYGLGAVVLAIPLLIYGEFAVAGLVIPAHTPGYHALVYAGAGLLLLAGAAINLTSMAAVAAAVLALFFAVMTLAAPLPQAFAHPAVWVSWEDLAESTVKVLGGVLAYALVSPAKSTGAAAIARVVRPLFGICLVVFGISEFVYAKFTASMVPAWLPPSQLAWAYVTGAAQIAAGLAVLSGVRARLAAILLTAMYLGFTLLVHLPRVMAHSPSRMNWAENGTNLVLAGAAWCLAEALGRFSGKRRKAGA
jgi:uncharacterized membrane protein YphA (DoxX/SURF4 family)